MRIASSWHQKVLILISREGLVTTRLMGNVFSAGSGLGAPSVETEAVSIPRSYNPLNGISESEEEGTIIVRRPPQRVLTPLAQIWTQESASKLQVEGLPVSEPGSDSVRCTVFSSTNYKSRQRSLCKNIIMIT